MSNIIGSPSIKKISSYAIFVTSIILSISLLRNITGILSSGDKISEVERRIDKLKLENKKLEIQVERVSSQEFIEAQARDKLGLAKEGEIVIVLPDEETLRILGKTSDLNEPDMLPDPNWKKWLNLFL